MKNEAAPVAWHLLPGRRVAEAFFEGSAAIARGQGECPFSSLVPGRFSERGPGPLSQRTAAGRAGEPGRMRVSEKSELRQVLEGKARRDLSVGRSNATPQQDRPKGRRPLTPMYRMCYLLSDNCLESAPVFSTLADWPQRSCFRTGRWEYVSTWDSGQPCHPRNRVSPNPSSARADREGAAEAVGVLRAKHLDAKPVSRPAAKCVNFHYLAEWQQ